MPADPSTPQELIGTGGWALGDAQARHRANPDTFWLPPAADLAALVPGTQARLLFQVADLADPITDGLAPYDEHGHPNLVVAHERMWVWVESVTPDGELVGVLDNLPVGTHSRLVPGARVRFRPTDVIDLVLDPPVPMAEALAMQADLGFPLLDADAVVAPEDPRRDPTIAPGQAEVCARAGVRPERPAPVPFVQALVGRSVQEGAWPVYGGRFRPVPERRDCGWVLWAGQPDLDAAAEAGELEITPITDVHHRHPGAWAHLALPPGWAFILFEDGSTDVYADPGLLE